MEKITKEEIQRIKKGPFYLQAENTALKKKLEVAVKVITGAEQDAIHVSDSIFRRQIKQDMRAALNKLNN